MIKSKYPRSAKPRKETFIVGPEDCIACYTEGERLPVTILVRAIDGPGCLAYLPPTKKDECGSLMFVQRGSQDGTYISMNNLEDAYVNLQARECTLFKKQVGKLRYK